MDHIRLGSEAVRFVRLYNLLVFLLLLLISSKFSFVEGDENCNRVRVTNSELLGNYPGNNLIQDTVVYQCVGRCGNQHYSCQALKLSEKEVKVEYGIGNTTGEYMHPSAEECGCGYY
ncbi:Uncharacterised protein g1675 [Pycnogonum litorale]